MSSSAISELSSFREYVGNRIADGEVGLSPEQALSDWRELQESGRLGRLGTQHYWSEHRKYGEFWRLLYGTGARSLPRKGQTRQQVALVSAAANFSAVRSTAGSECPGYTGASNSRVSWRVR